MDFAKEFIVPLALLVFGIVGKWIVKAKWDWEFVAMGPDLILAAIASDLVHGIDHAALFFVKINDPHVDYHAEGKGLAMTGGFLFVGLFAYVLTLKIHQWLVPTFKLSGTAKGFLRSVSSAIGVGSLGTLLYLIKHP